MKTTIEARIADLITTLKREAHSDEDRERVESMQQTWVVVQGYREAKELKILLLQQELDQQAEELAAVLDE
jgi:hypothetical protein